MNLSHGSQSHTGNNPQNVEEGCQVGLGNAPCPRGEENCDGRRGLEHLDKGDREVEVDDIGANERAGVKDTNGEDCSSVEARSQGQLLAGVEERRGSSEDLGSNGSKN